MDKASAILPEWIFKRKAQKWSEHVKNHRNTLMCKWVIAAGKTRNQSTRKAVQNGIHYDNSLWMMASTCLPKKMITSILLKARTFILRHKSRFLEFIKNTSRCKTTFQ